ncbi:MAG: nickel-type superoxide dismutase maturation protease [Pleurocapsa sp.]
MADILPRTSYYELLMLVLRRRKRLKVVGESMQPFLNPGDEILVDPYAYHKNLPRINDIVVTKHPQVNNLKIVKRVSAIERNDQYFLTGDNPIASTDSRHWGVVGLLDIVGKVTSRFA